MSKLLPSSPSLESDSQLGLPEIPLAHPPLASLAQVRSEKNMTPEFAASSLRLRTPQIVALEQCNWEQLPGPAYIKGFLRSYCKFLGVDAQPYLDQYVQTQLPEQHVSAPLAVVAPLSPVVEPAMVSAAFGDPQLPLAHFDEANEINLQRKRTIWTAVAIVGATLLFLLVWERALWLGPLQAKLNQWLPAATLPVAPPKTEAAAALAVPSVSASAPVEAPLSVAPIAAPIATVGAAVAVTPETKAVAASPELQTINAAKTSNAKTVDVQFLEPVWVELRDKSGAVIMTGMQKPATAARIKADAPLLLIVGASHAVSVKVDSKALDLAPHTVGNVSKVKIP